MSLPIQRSAFGTAISLSKRVGGPFTAPRLPAGVEEVFVLRKSVTICPGSHVALLCDVARYNSCFTTAISLSYSNRLQGHNQDRWAVRTPPLPLRHQNRTRNMPHFTTGSGFYFLVCRWTRCRRLATLETAASPATALSCSTLLLWCIAPFPP
jgi:hypothetical protein